MSGRSFYRGERAHAPNATLYRSQRQPAAAPQPAMPRLPAVIPLGSPAAHTFANVRVHTDRPPASPSPRPQIAQSDGARAQDGRPAVAQPPPPVPTPTPAPAAPAAPATPSLALENDTYTDSGNTSHKVIKFNVTVPSGLTARDYALVNKLKGHMKKADGTYWKVQMYGSLVDFNFTSEQVDSVDADPVYWSNSSGRWNYVTTSTGFYATDDPGPPGHAFSPGDEAAVKFKIGLYRLADVPTTTTGTISATPLQELPWQYSVKAAADGTLSHPAL